MLERYKMQLAQAVWPPTIGGGYRYDDTAKPEKITGHGFHDAGRDKCDTGK
jgi:hypothetical protein